MKMSCPTNNLSAGKCPVARTLHCYGELVTLIARVFMANIFWKSGMIMYAYYLSGDFDRQIEIFREGLGLPLPEAFAWFTMIAEIVLSILLAVGLFGRFAALVLIIVTAIVEFGQISNIDHVYWFLILSFILVRGSGKVSLDRIFCNAYARACEEVKSLPAATSTPSQTPVATTAAKPRPKTKPKNSKKK